MGKVKARKFKETEDISWIEKITKEKPTIEEQIPLIISEIEAGPIYYRCRDDIQNNLNDIMRFFYGDQRVRVCPFGSSVTTLALKNCDVDLFLDFIGELPESPKKFLMTLKRKIHKYRFFYRSIAIPARVPIVRCMHFSGISCDISFSQPLSVHNSRLIKFMVNIDERVRPLILLIKYLIKKEGINGFTSFCLTLLIVFYLQQLNKPLIPSVMELQNLAASKKIVSSWDASFTSDLSALTPSDNQSSVCDLLKGFFEFYSTFEFGFYAISVFTGKTYLKPVLANIESLPEEFKCYKQNFKRDNSLSLCVTTIMCVQDLFNHANNVSRNISERTCESFQDFCSDCVAVAQQECSGEGNNSPTYLLNLFKKGNEYKKSKSSQCINVYVCKDVFSSCNHDPLTEDEVRRQWSEKVFNSVKDILVKVMKCEVDVQCKGEQKSGSMNFTQADEVTLHCELSYIDLILKNRNDCKQEFEFPQNMSIISQEEIISNYICDTMLKDVPKLSLKFEMTCILKKGPTHFCFYLDTKEQIHKHLVEKAFKFMETKFPQWIQ